MNMTKRELKSLDVLLLTNTRVQLLIKEALTIAGSNDPETVLTELLNRLNPDGYQKGLLLIDTQKEEYSSRYYYNTLHTQEEGKKIMDESLPYSQQDLEYRLSQYAFGYISNSKNSQNDIPLFFPANINMLKSIRDFADSILNKKIDAILEYRVQNQLTN